MRITRHHALALTAIAVVATAPGIAVPGNAHADGPVNLRVDDRLRADLVVAGAALKGMPVSDFTGLKSGATYYAYDPSTDTHWAAGHLVPSANSYDAQVADQDAGSYTLFERPGERQWIAFNDGLPRGDRCPAPLPAAVATLWRWNPSRCRPTGEG